MRKLLKVLNEETEEYEVHDCDVFINDYKKVQEKEYRLETNPILMYVIPLILLCITVGLLIYNLISTRILAHHILLICFILCLYTVVFVLYSNRNMTVNNGSLIYVEDLCKLLITTPHSYLVKREWITVELISCIHEIYGEEFITYTLSYWDNNNVLKDIEFNFDIHEKDELTKMTNHLLKNGDGTQYHTVKTY